MFMPAATCEAKGPLQSDGRPNARAPFQGWIENCGHAHHGQHHPFPFSLLNHLSFRDVTPFASRFENPRVTSLGVELPGFPFACVHLWRARRVPGPWGGGTAPAPLRRARCAVRAVVGSVR